MCAPQPVEFPAVFKSCRVTPHFVHSILIWIETACVGVAR